MRQPPPRYPDRAIAQYPEITQTLRDRYGASYWPVIWYELESQQVIGVTYEVNSLNDTNISLRGTNEPVLSSGTHLIAEAFADYVIEPREPPQNLGPALTNDWPPADLTAVVFDNTYGYVTSTPGVSTVDLDYAWWTGTDWRGLELTTFFVPMNSEARARYLIRRFVEERVSRQGAHHLMILARFAERMGISMRLVFANTVSQTDGTLVADGNVAVVVLNVSAATELQSGSIPNFRFLRFTDWLKSL